MRWFLVIILSISIVSFSLATSNDRYRDNYAEKKLFDSVVHSLSWFKYWYGTFWGENSYQKRVNHITTVYYSVTPTFPDLTSEVKHFDGEYKRQR